MDLTNIEGLSQDELIAMEDEAVEADETQEETTEEPKVPEAVEEEPVKEETVETPEADEVEEVETTDEDVEKHVSPPKKWAAQRAAARQAKQATEKAGKLEAENAELKSKLSWLSAQATSKGVDVDKTPADMLTPEKILAVREEFGDELADMFQAVAQSSTKPAAQETPKAEDENTAMEEAISDNDELSYWRKNSPDLWQRAISTNDGFITDPEYLKLPFDKRFEYVVNAVKDEVVKEAKEKAVKQGADKGEPPPSLSGSGSPPPTATEKNDLDDILNAKPEEQAKLYSALTEAQRDEVDIALGI